MNNKKNVKNIIISKSNDVMAFINREKASYMYMVKIINKDTNESLTCNTALVFNKFENYFVRAIKNDIDENITFEDFKVIKCKMKLEKDGDQYIPIGNIILSNYLYADISLEKLLNEEEYENITWKF